MATLKECKENERKTNEAIQTVEKYLNCKNGHWNNVKKVYTFEFGERFNEREIELSNYALFHIASLVTDLN